MIRILLLLTFFTVQAHAGLTPCHDPILVKNRVKALSSSSKNILSISSITEQFGCSSNTKVVIKSDFINLVDLTDLENSFMVIREISSLNSRSQQTVILTPFILVNKNFKLKSNSELVISNQVQVGDILHIKIPSFPVLAFKIK